MLNYYAFHILQRPFLWLEDSEYLQNVFNLWTLIEMVAKDSYPEQAKCNFVKLLTQSMHSEFLLIFYRKIKKSSIFFNENSLNIFVELFTPLIEMQNVKANEVHVLHAKCTKISSFYGSLESFNILPHVCLWGNI